MAEQPEPGLSEQYTRASPWPIPLVLGIVTSEIGIVFDGLLPVAVGGLLLFAVSVVGILRESGFSDTLWKPALGLAVVFGAFGVALYAGTAAEARGLALIGSAVVIASGALAAFLYETERL